MFIATTIRISPTNKQFHMKLFKEALRLSGLDELNSFECDTMPDQAIRVFFRTNEIEPADFVTRFPADRKKPFLKRPSALSRSTQDALSVRNVTEATTIR